MQVKEGAVHLHIKEGNLAATKPSAYSSPTFDGKLQKIATKKRQSS